MKTILSLFDFTGAWSEPYVKAGYHVVRLDIKNGDDVFAVDLDFIKALAPHGLLIAIPCDDFAASGARWWADKDADGRTEASCKLAEHVIKIIAWAQPTWWALENPVGRLGKLFPEFGKPWYFQPHWFGDAYTKKTGLWGTFNRNLKRNNVEPIMYENNGKFGSWQWRFLGGKSAKTKELRSTTPSGFAQAFFEANP